MPRLIASGHPFQGCHRLREAAEFSVVFNHRRVLRGERFHLHYRPAPPPVADLETAVAADTARELAGPQPRSGLHPGPRLGLVVAKKLARRAVLRNLVKRIARESFRQLRPDLPPCDLVLRLAKPPGGTDGASRRAMRAEIDDLLRRLGEQLSRR